MIMIYSPNMLKTFEECPQKFFLKYIERMALPQRSTIFEKGKKIHALANYYLNGENIEKMEKTLTVDEKIAWEALKSSEYFKLNVFNTEYNLSCKVDKYWIGGRLDALMFDSKNSNDLMENGAVSLRGVCKADDAAIQKTPHSSLLTPHYYILDYKTGKIPPNAEQDFQTIVYLLAADKFLNKKDGYNSLKFIYLGLKNTFKANVPLNDTPHPNPYLSPNDTQSFGSAESQGERGQIEQKEIILTPELKKQYEEKIIDTCKKIDLAVFSEVFSQNKERCKNCEYTKFCTKL
jgi:CRISPR/Cas system-associated exonuclease Cas4 (RecB family)